MKMILHLVVLLFGSVWLSVMSENIAGFRTFSLPFLNILLVMLVGATLSIWSGWTETLSTITVYGAYCVLGGHPKPATDGQLKTGHHT